MEIEAHDVDIDKFMDLAIEMGIKGLDEGEVPVGCVFYHTKSSQIIASSHNLSNKTKNAITHAEINCINEISRMIQIKDQNFFDRFKLDNQSTVKSIMNESILFVTCEPCIMCAYALSIVGINKVFFGCENDRFGGNGSILSLNLGFIID